MHNMSMPRARNSSNMWTDLRSKISIRSQSVLPYFLEGEGTIWCAAQRREKCRRNENEVWGDGQSTCWCSTESMHISRNGLIRIWYLQFVEREKSCFSYCSLRCYSVCHLRVMPTQANKCEKGGSAFFKQIHKHIW